MINKYLIIFFVLFLIILFLLLLSYLFKDKTHTESFTNNDLPNISTQNISHESHNDLIINGSFEGGKTPGNHVNQNGYNKIIMKKNPGSSSYVLEQKKTDELTYYEFICPNEKNSKYNLYFWLSISNANANELDMEKLIKIKIQKEDFSNYIPRLNYNIIQKVMMTEDDKNTWYLIKYDFISEGNTGEKMNLYLNYGTNLQYDYYYFTNISLYRVLIDAENFIYNNKLISYVDGYHYESNSETWQDLSGAGNDLFWSNIPIVDYTKGQLTTLPLKLKGFSSNTLSNEQCSILFCLNKNIENKASDDSINEEDSLTNIYLISVPGNERYSFEIEFKDNYLYLINGTETYRTKNEVILYNKSLLTIMYDNGTIYILQDGNNILTEKVKKLYFSKDNILINRNKNLNFNFYSILFYNRLIDNKELDQIREYFITNQNKNFNKHDINIYHMNNTAQYTSNKSDNFLFKPFNKKAVMNNYEDNIFIDNFRNHNNQMNASNGDCSIDCTNLCTTFSDDVNSDKYKQCISNCSNVLTSCQNYCDDNNNKNSVYCNPSNGATINLSINDGSNGSNGSNGSTVSDASDCPTVYKKDGKYYVYVSPNSTYSKKLNYSGERSYGANLAKAKYTYTTNFPECPVPLELIQTAGNNETCPYIINELNPCYTSVCAGVKWDVDNFNDLNLNKNCKKAVSNYCHINNTVDDKCICWNPKYKNDPKCIEMRRYFEDAKDYCEPNQFKIEDHPDFNKYIKKDDIPCWGCNLSM